MKSNFFYGVILALVLGSLSSCSDNLTTDVQEKADSDQVRYLNVSVSSPTGAGTRAGVGDFNEGSDAENAVKDLYFVFYDAEGNVTGSTTHVKNPTFNKDEERPSVNSIYSSTVSVTLSQGDNLPSYVMCFINPISTADFATASRSEIELIKRRAVTTQVKTTTGEGDEAVTTTTTYFPMSNSAYYGLNPVTGEQNARMVATPIAVGELYKNSADAKKALDAGKTTDIYVERYAARIALSLTPDKIQEVTDNNEDIVGVNGYTLKFVPDAWRPNAIDQELYAVKTYGILDADNNNNNKPVYTPTYAQVAEKLDPATKGDSWWNDRNNFRSYWGCSPSYYENDYPQVSDDITDKVADNAHNDNYPYKLHYFNYDQIIKNTTGATTSKEGDGAYSFYNSITWDVTNGFNEGTSGSGKVFYARETTTAVDAWQGENKLYNPLAALASAVIVGHYQLTAEGDSPSVPAPAQGQTYTTFYLYGKTGNNWNLYFDNSIAGAMIDNQNVVYKKIGETYTIANKNDDAGIFIVEHPSMDVRTAAGTTVAGRLVALQLSGVPATAYYFYDTTKKVYEQITTTNINKVNADLLTAGFARKYGDGLCYYNIPIEHLGIHIYSSATGQTGEYVTGAKTANGYDFTKCPAGSFGIVRNHVYNINIKSIKGLATALRDANQPIVPPMDEVEYYISARVNILNWRIVPAQNVTL